MCRVRRERLSRRQKLLMPIGYVFDESESRNNFTWIKIKGHANLVALRIEIKEKTKF